MRTIALIISVVLLSAVLRADELEFAVDKALQTPRSDFLQSTPVAFLSLSNIHVKLHPVFLLEKKGPVHILAGTIELDETTGKTRTIGFRITKQAGTIKNIVLQINDEMPQAMSESMTRALGKFFTPGPMEQDERERIVAGLRSATDGTWLSIVELVVAQIAIRHC